MARKLEPVPAHETDVYRLLHGFEQRVVAGKPLGFATFRGLWQDMHFSNIFEVRCELRSAQTCCRAPYRLRCSFGSCRPPPSAGALVKHIAPAQPHNSRAQPASPIACPPRRATPVALCCTSSTCSPCLQRPRTACCTRRTRCCSRSGLRRTCWTRWSAAALLPQCQMPLNLRSAGSHRHCRSQLCLPAHRV